jgi:hypothetical protein
MARRAGYSQGGGSGTYGPWMSGPPTFTGTPQAGVAFTANMPATITGNPTPASTYQWKWADTGAAISGATAGAYTPISGDVGHTLALTLTSTNATGSVALTSAASSAVIAAAGSGLQTATWQNLSNASDSGSGTIVGLASGWMRGRTAQTITGDGYFEAIPGTERDGTVMCLHTGTLPAVPTDGTDIQDLIYQLRITPGDVALYQTAGAGNAATYRGEWSGTVVGATWRLEMSGTDLLVKRNGTTLITLSGETFSGAYYGYYRAYSDTSAGDALPTLTVAKIYD